jgi:hypothetical protein
VCTPIALGTNTDPYQPIEREWKVTPIVEVLSGCDHPLTITTKGAWSSATSISSGRWRPESCSRLYLDPDTRQGARAQVRSARTGTGARSSGEGVADAGIPVGVMVAPVIRSYRQGSRIDPRGRGRAWRQRRVVDHAAAAARGCAAVRDWLATHYPLRAAHVMSLVNQIRGGKDNDPRFGDRMRGSGQPAGSSSVDSRSPSIGSAHRGSQAPRHDVVSSAARGASRRRRAGRASG